MILFTADLHIKIGQKNVPVDWAKNRYKTFIHQLNEIEKDVTLHIMGGDVFDRVPNMEELAVFFDIVKACSVRTLIYSGNHEATKKGKTFLSLLANVANSLNPLVTIIDYVYETDKFTIVPYEFIHDKTLWGKLDKNLPVFSHIRGAIEPHVKPEIDLSLIKDFPVVYLGDLHSHSNCQANLVYPGSPMTTSFHRSKVDTGYLLIEDNLLDWSWHKFCLPQLIRKTVTDPADMVPTSPDHTIYEIEGNISDLSNIKNSDILDKKLVKRSRDTTLVLGNKMTIEDELKEYFMYVLELPEDKIKELISIYHDYIKDIEMG